MTFLGFVFLSLQLVVGFVPKEKISTEILAVVLHTTFWVWFALLLQIVALIGALLEYWLDVRGPGKPIPRIDIHS